MNSRHLKMYALALMMGSSLHASVVRISDENQYNSQVLGSNKRVLVEFSADWCSVCNGIQKSFEEVANENEFGDITFVQVDVDKCDNVSKQNGIVGVPTFVYLENGTKKVEEIGVQNMPAFQNHLRENLRKTFQVADNQTVPQMQAPAEMPEMEKAKRTAMPSQPAPAAQEPNFIMGILNSIKDFIMLLICKIKGFFTTIIDAIKGFFE